MVLYIHDGIVLSFSIIAALLLVNFYVNEKNKKESEQNSLGENNLIEKNENIEENNEIINNNNKKENKDNIKLNDLETQRNI